MLANIKNENFEEEVVQNTKMKNSYKLRAMYLLSCMRPKSLHNVLFDLLSACDATGFKLFPNEPLKYLAEYDKDNIDHIRIIEAIYEILCQVHDESLSCGESVLVGFRGYPSIRPLIIDEGNEEEYRPYEDIDMESVIEIAVIAIEKGPYSSKNLGVSDPQSDEEWYNSAEYLYTLENTRLFEKSKEIEKSDSLLVDLSEEEMDSDILKPAHQVLEEQEQEVLLQEGIVEKSLWTKFKEKYTAQAPAAMNVEMEDILLKDVEDVVLDGLYIDEDDVREHITEDAVAQEEAVSAMQPQSKWFGDLQTRQDCADKGFYGYVRLLGLFTIKKGIYVATRDEIRAAENQIHPLLREFSKVNWLTRDGTHVAYY